MNNVVERIFDTLTIGSLTTVDMIPCGTETVISDLSGPSAPSCNDFARLSIDMFHKLVYLYCLAIPTLSCLGSLYCISFYVD